MKGTETIFSLQAGAFVFPGLPFVNMPIVLSGKFSLPKKAESVRLAGGMMYVSFPINDASLLALLLVQQPLGTGSRTFQQPWVGDTCETIMIGNLLKNQL